MKEEKLVALLRELIKNSKRSDRELAKAIGASQPTVTRNRRTLDKYIRNYTIIPEFSKIGYEILAITFAKARTYNREETGKKVESTRNWMKTHANIIFASEGEGLGKDAVTISLHENYSNYANFIRDYSLGIADFLSDVQSFVVSLKTGVVFKPLDLTNLVDDIKDIHLEG